ncbi:MAG: DUF3108 domain-containing protein [Bacteroidales bacterium]|nr:DUF3108 domain-containing protein [Bacteroidales bacterium]
MAICSLHAQEYGDSLRKASCIPVRELSQDNLAFQAGEQMSFVLHYKWGAVNSDVGNATVRLDTLTYNGEKAFQCSVYGKTTRWYDLFFKVREDFKSWFTCDGLRPLKFTRDTFEGNYQAKNTYIYDWSQDEPRIIADVYSSSSGQRYPEIPLTPCTFDLPSLFYFARNMDMDVVEQGKRYPMTFAIDDDVYNVYFIMHGRETIKVKGFGTVNTIRFAAKLLAGEVFTGEEDMTIWISDDENRVPVYFEAPLLVGKATGRMTGYEGLKYPFTSFQGKKRR